MQTGAANEPRTPLTDYEKERGKPAPDVLHSIAQTRILLQLHAGCDDSYMVLPELDLEFADGTVRTPDICILPKRKINWGLEPLLCREVPLLAVEVLLLGQTNDDVLDRLDVYFTHSVQSAWVVNPSLQAITTYLPNGQRSQIIRQGEVKDPASGLSVWLEEVFA